MRPVRATGGGPTARRPGLGTLLAVSSPVVTVGRPARPRAVVGLVAALLLALAVTACTSGGDTDGDEAVTGSSDEGSSEFPARDARRPTIRLGVTDWTGARINVAIAELLIERRLGYPVEAVPVLDMAPMLRDLESGELDAVLELWPSGLIESERKAIDDGPFVDLGPLGVEGKVGWWVPRYVVDGELGVRSWEDLGDPDVVAALAVPSGGDRGRFLGTDPSYEQYDEELIEALELPYDVDYSGSDAATEAEVAAATAAGRPILLYWWTPTALVARHDLVNVALPPRTDECLAERAAGGPTRCDYPVDRLFKLGSPALADKAPDVEGFLRAFRLDTDDQLDLIDAVENEGRAVGEAAGAWVDANGDRWSAWLP